MIRTFHTVDALARAAMELFVQTAQSAVAARGRFTVALSGGNSPRPLYELLASPAGQSRMPWESTYVFWGDERYVPLDDPDSNAGNARKILLDRVPVPTEQIFPIYDPNLPAEKAAEAYERALREQFDNGLPRFDLILLGCGTNGHSASLFPGTDVLGERQRLAAAVNVPGQDLTRITLTVPVINRARVIVFIAFGSEKAAVIRNVIAGPRRPNDLPAQLIEPVDGNLYWLLDTEAAAELVSPAQ